MIIQGVTIYLNFWLISSDLYLTQKVKNVNDFQIFNQEIDDL